MTLRILFLTREPHPSFRPDIVTLFGQQLPKYGIYTDLVALQDAEGSPTWTAGRIFTRCSKSRVSRLLARYCVAFDLFRLCDANHYCALQVRDRVLGALIGLLIARWRRLPFFYWMSFPFPEAWQDLGAGQAANSGSLQQRLRWKIRGWLAALILYRLVLPHAAHIFVQSEAMLEMLVRRGLRSDMMTPVPMGVAMPSALDCIEPMDDPRLAGRRVIAYLGALERLRHPEIMLEAMVKVARQAPDALLVLVGDSQTPGEREWLENEIVRLGLQGHAFITGWMAPAQAWRYLRSARLGLSPIPRTRVLEVGSPTKVCEYLAYGIPVIANDQPDQVELIEQTKGGLCVAMSANGFADGILELLADPERAYAMARAGRESIRQLRSYEVLGAALAERYRQLLGIGAPQ